MSEISGDGTVLGEVVGRIIIPADKAKYLYCVLSKVQESFTVKWILENVQKEISVSQFGGLAGS